jgi:tripartite-type tricarboxylate transporter receptor subunit TctC
MTRKLSTRFHTYRRLILVLATSGLAPLLAQAQTAPWPTKAVTAVVPFAPGGAGNGSLRILSEIISPQLGQPLVVENRPGAGGITGTQTVTSSADDHLLLMGSTTMTILPSLRNDLPYDAQRDLQPIGMISAQPVVLAVPANSPLKTLDDLLRMGRAGQLSAGNSGVGTLSHLTTELLNNKLGTKILAVPYKGDAALIPDVVAGTISMGVMNLPVAMPMIQAGRLRALAVTSAQPVAQLPGVPVLKTLGNEFVVSGWAALFAGPKVPPAGVKRIELLLKQALSEPATKDKFAAFGVNPEPGTAAELREFVKSETARWGDVIRTSGIKLQP